MAAGRHLPDLSAVVRGLERRRGGGPRRNHRPPGPPPGARGRGDLALADLHVADGRLRLRRLRLLRRRPGVRHARRPRRADRGLPRARHQARARLGPEPQLRPAPVVQGVPLEPRQPQARLVHVARRQGRRPAQRLDVGVQGRRPGVDLRRGHRPVVPALASWPSSPTSTGRTPRSSRRCTTCCASGWTAASTGCASTRSPRSPRTRCCATRRARPAATTRTGSRSTSYLRGIRKVIDEYDDRMIVGEVALQDLHRVVGYLESGDQLHLAHNFVFIDQDWDAETYATSIADFEALAEETAWPAWFLGQPRQPPPRQPLRPRRARRAALARDPGDALRAARDAVHLPGRGARAAGRDDPAGPRSSTSTAATPSARRSRGRRTRPATASPPATPWLPFVDDAGDAQRADPGRGPALDAAISRARSRALRASSATLATGEQQPFDAGAGILAWTREDEDERLLVAVNFTDRDAAAGRSRVSSCCPATRAGTR